MSAKDTTVNIRVSAETKARWQVAAGGPRKVSAWLTKLADEASGTPSVAASVGESDPRADVSGKTPEREGVSKEAPKRLVEDEASAGQCPRWMHHRKGVYCGTCKKVN